MTSLKPSCALCKRDEDDKVLYGNFYHEKGLDIHEYCLFFASGLSQNGEDEKVGITGFLIDDIHEEIKRSGKLRCSYCKVTGASIGCIVRACRKTFHLPCGVEHHALNQFRGSFPSFCSSHKLVQKKIRTPKDKLSCNICFFELSENDFETCLYAPCCKNNWFHRRCLQEYASSAGRYYFKCPICKEYTKFLNEMEKYGICIPDKDASWELEENAFGELLCRPDCGASVCLSSKGRNFDGDKLWTLERCSDCGSQARHRYCEKLKGPLYIWKCEDCVAFEEESKKTELGKKKICSKNEVKSRIASIDVLNLGASCSYASSNDLVKQNGECSQSVKEKKKVPIYLEKVKDSELAACSSSRSVSRSSHLKDDVCDKLINCSISEVGNHSEAVPKDNLKKSENVTKELKRKANTAKENCVNSNKKTKELVRGSKKKCLRDNNMLNYVSPSSVFKSRAVTKSPSKRKVPKSKKMVTCCSGSSQCIKKMFGLECHQYWT